MLTMVHNKRLHYLKTIENFMTVKVRRLYDKYLFLERKNIFAGKIYIVFHYNTFRFEHLVQRFFMFCIIS